MSGIRSALRAALAAAAVSAACAPAAAQPLPYGSIGLYVDENRESNTASYSGTFTEFTMYVFCRPGAEGLQAVEFVLRYPANVIQGPVTASPLLSVALGTLDGGMSAAFFDCQGEWVWTHHQQLFVTSGDAARIEIDKHPLAGALQAATCELGNPLEALLVSSVVCLNSPCPPDTASPRLLGAANISANGVELAFSEELLKQTAENPSNYEIADLNDPAIAMPVAEARLLADGRTARIYASAQFVGGRSYVVRVHDVLDPWGNAVPPSSERTFTVIDQTPPRLIGAHAESDQALTVAFNEAMTPSTAENPANYRLYFYIDPVVPANDIPCNCFPHEATLVSADTVVLSFEVPAMPIGRTLLLRVRNVTDLAGNVISASHNVAEFVVPDPYPPWIVSLGMPGADLLDVNFSERVVSSTASDAGNYAIYERDDTLSFVPVTGAELLEDEKTARLSLGAPLEFETPYVLRARNVADLFGNVIAPPGTIEFKKSDFFPPVPLSAAALSHTLIRIVFNKQLEETSAETALYYTVFETANAAAAIPVSGATLEESGDAVQLGLAGWLVPNIDYTVHIAGVEDLAGHAIASASITTSYPDTLPPAIVGVELVGDSAFEILFSNFLDAVSAGEEANYLLCESSDPGVILPILSAALAGDGSRVLISLGEALLHGRSYTLTVSGVADWKGMVIAPGTTRTFTFYDTIPPALLGAHATDDTTVVANFSEPLDDTTAETPSNYRIFVQDDPSRAVPVSSAVLAGDSSSVELSLAGALTAGIVYALEAAGVADRAGNPVAAGGAALFSIHDTLAPSVEWVRQESFEVVYVWFSEAVTAATAGDPSNYALVGVAQPSDTAAPSSADCIASRLVRLAFAPPFAPGRIYELVTSGVEDLAGNVISPGDGKRFVSSPYPAGGGLGLYLDKNHSMSDVNYSYGPTEFRMYVWCAPGEYGASGAEFVVNWTSNVLPGPVTVNTPFIVSTTGDPFSGMSATFSQCVSDWVWICRETCYLMDPFMSVLALGSETGLLRLVTCAEGNPPEKPNVVSDIRCNHMIIATLLAGFSAVCRDGSIDVEWRLSRLDGDARFAVSRAAGMEEDYAPLAGEVHESGLSFSYRDEGVEPGGVYRYRVDFIDGEGARVLFETEPIGVPALPLTLHQNWPNPFNPATTVAYYLPDDANVRLEVFDVAGRRIALLANGREARGRHSASWNGADDAGRPVAAGIYICRLTADKETLSRKMILMR